MQSSAKQHIEQYCRGADSNAFSQFYRAESPRLWQFLKNRDCNDGSAYDLLSETFLKFIQVVCKGPHAPVALLYKIAINCHIDCYRRAKVSPNEPVTIDIEQQPSHITETQTQQSYVDSRLKKLPQDEQSLLFMSYRVGFTGRHGAQVMYRDSE